MARAAAKPKQQKTLEQRLWDAADALRGNQEPSEYKHVVLGLVFLKYISDPAAPGAFVDEAGTACFAYRRKQPRR